jgi:uncharacterized membrane protein (DUF2068 family)
MHGEAGLSLIVAWKAIKASALTLAAALVLGSVRGALLETLAARIAEPLHLTPERVAAELTRGHVVWFCAGMLSLAGLYVLQAVGLHYRRRWAAWLTLVPTSSLIPLEVYRVVEHPHALRVATLVVNLLIVWYLARSMKTLHWRKHGERPQDEEAG